MGHASHETLSDALRRATGHNPARCYQCGKCSAGCPMAAETELRPHDVLRMVNLDQRERLLAAESLWLCLGCETCTTRCPGDCDPAGVIGALREMVLSRPGGAPPRALAAFHSAFLDQIRTRGRVSELGMIAGYKLRSGALFQDVTAGPAMMQRGKLRLSSPKVLGLHEVRHIFDACKSAEEGDR